MLWWFHTVNNLINSLIWSVCLILVVFSAINIDCEREFSNVNRFKNNLRNRLKKHHLESLLRTFTIKMNAITFFQHRDILTICWKRLCDRKMTEKGDVQLNENAVIDWRHWFEWLYCLIRQRTTSQVLWNWRNFRMSNASANQLTSSLSIEMWCILTFKLMSLEVFLCVSSCVNT